ncbi:MAG: hypothetical protein ACLFR1_07300 [Spirochaetia bacterium]
MKRICLIFITFLFLFSYLITSCSGNDEEQAEEENDTAQETQVQEPEDETQVRAFEPSNSESMVLTETGRESIREEKIEEQRTIDQPVETSSISPFLTSRSGMYIVPIDFEIGPLSNTWRGDEYSGLYNLADQFLSGLLQANINSNLVSAQQRQYIQSLLQPQIESGYIPEQYRIGSIQRSSDLQANCNIRLMQDGSSAEGEVFFVLQNGSWFIEDVQVDLFALTIERPERTEPFMPESYDLSASWM